MAPVLMRVRAELRARWRVWVSLTLMLGLFGGAVIAIAAGARRTDTAYQRFLDWSHAPDVYVPHFPAEFTGGVFGEVDLDDVEELPQVVESSRLLIFDTKSPLSLNAPEDGRTYVTMGRPKVIEGRMPRPDRPFEVAVNWLRAADLGIEVGDTISEHLLPYQAAAGEGLPAIVRFHVVGLEAASGGFPPTLTDLPGMILSRAFADRFGDGYSGFHVSVVRLHRGFADIPPFLAEVRRLAQGKSLFTERQDTQAANVDRSFHLQAIVLWLLAGLTGLVTLLVFGQMLARQTFIESDENPILSSLGMTRSQLLAVALLRVGFVAVGGAVLAVVVASLASSLFPTGLARVAEPDGGFRLDWMALGLGGFGIIAVVGALSALPAWRAASRSAEEEGAATVRPSRVAVALSRAGISSTGAAGVRMALEPGRGRTAVPVRTAIAGVTIGIAALSAALTFGASLDHLLETPEQYGVTWDVQVYANTGAATTRLEHALARTADADPHIQAYALGTTAIGMTVDEVPADSVALYTRPGAVSPPILSGRAPSAIDEIALGPNTLAQLGKHVGQMVRVSVFTGDPKPMRVVGEAVTPPIGDVGRFGKGALLDFSSAQYLVPGAPAADTLLIRVRPGEDPQAVGAAIAARLERDPDVQNDDPNGVPIEVTTPEKPTDLVNFGRVQNFPLYLAGLVALMAAATLAHVLVTSIRRRRRDLAILKTLGFQRGQLSSTVAWQATTLSLVALLIGIPIGVAAGRWVWTSFADNLGILPSPAVPIAAILITIPATLLLANLIAYVPGRAAARVSAATVLRTE